jgi:hypothetical protein
VTNVKRNCDSYDENFDPILNTSHWISSRCLVAICNRFFPSLWWCDLSIHSSGIMNRVPLEYSVVRLYNEVEVLGDGRWDIAG